MIIPIDDETRVRGTKLCWQLERARTVKGETEWRAYKYFMSVDRALREAAQHEIRTIPAIGLSQAIEACNRVTEKYSKIFDDVGKFDARVK